MLAELLRAGVTVVGASGLQLSRFYVEADLPFGVLSSAHSWVAVVWFRGAVRGADFWLWSLSCQSRSTCCSASASLFTFSLLASWSARDVRKPSGRVHGVRRRKLRRSKRRPGGSHVTDRGCPLGEWRSSSLGS